MSGYDWDTAFPVSTTLGIDDGLVLVFPLRGRIRAELELEQQVLA